MKFSHVIAIIFAVFCIIGIIVIDDYGSSFNPKNIALLSTIGFWFLTLIFTIWMEQRQAKQKFDLEKEKQLKILENELKTKKESEEKPL